MNPSFLSLNTRVQEALPDVTCRGLVLAAAVGISLSRNLPLPSSVVEDPTNYYNMQCLGSVKDSVGNINENLVLDCKGAMEWTRNLWLVRYYAAHPQPFTYYGGDNGSFFESFFNASTLISIEGRKLLEESRVALAIVSLEVSAALQAEVSRNTPPGY